MESKIIYDSSIDQELIKSKKVAVIGFGSQGHAHSLNLHESGVDITVGLREESESFSRAKEMGLKVANLENATKNADIVMLLLPDQVMADVYNTEISTHMKEGATLLFAHGFNIHFNEIVPREDLSVAMVAPKGPGHLLRRTYAEGSGMPCLVAVHKDASGNAENIAMSYASAIGGGRAGILRTTFKEETETDLMYEGGFEWMRHSISDTAEYGDFSRGSRIITSDTKDEMKKVLQEIQSGAFAKEWMAQAREGAPFLNEKRAEASKHQLEEVGKGLRKMMPFLNAKDVTKDK